MTYFDVFNGDADGLCALTQLRNAEPIDSILITGVKRDIQLLQQVTAKDGDKITVLDISMDKNKKALLEVLESGAHVFYCDHHATGDVPEKTGLQSLVNTDANVCTSLLVNAYLKGQFALWAIVGAFGDNLKDSAHSVAKPLGLSERQLTQLENLGTYINYNGYGASLDDLHFTPENLYREMVKFSSPFDFMHENSDVFKKLEAGYHDDMAKVAALNAVSALPHAAVFMLPDEPWARRVSGVYSNELANNSPDRAHAVLTEKADGGFLVSIRAPLNNKQGAVDICSQFATGGGRAAAAGINHLPKTDIDHFIDVFQAYYA